MVATLDHGVGVLVFDGGAGWFEDCNIHDNATKDWDRDIRDGCNTTVREGLSYSFIGRQRQD